MRLSSSRLFCSILVLAPSAFVLAHKEQHHHEHHGHTNGHEYGVRHQDPIIPEGDGEELTELQKK
jgi:hypothetical protein